MRSEIGQTILIILLLMPVSLFGQEARVSSTPTNPSSFDSAHCISYESYVDAISNDIQITTYNESEVVDGYTIVSARRCIVDLSRPQGYTILDNGGIMTDMDGNVLNYFPNGAGEQFHNSTTMLVPYAANYTLVNFYTNDTEILQVKPGHHDTAYNPVDKQIMLLTYDFSPSEIWENKPVLYDGIWIYDINGTPIWSWNASLYLPFNSTMYDSRVSQIFLGATDWMHSNSLAWDWENQVVYLNARNLNTVYCINITSSEIIYSIGQWGDFTLIDRKGNHRDTLWYMSHGLEMTRSNRLIMFDNDMFNYSNPESLAVMNGWSRYLEIELDVENKVATEIWSYTAPDDDLYYYPRTGGDANRIPGGNTLGTFGVKGFAFTGTGYKSLLTEVNPSGEIVWEMLFNNKSGYFYWLGQEIDRVYPAPIIEVNNITEDIVHLTTWNCIKEHYSSQATFRVLEGQITVYEDDFRFSPHWMPTYLFLDLTRLTAGHHNLTIEIENIDGVVGSLYISVDGPASDMAIFYFIAGSGVVAVMVTVVYIKRRTV
ncbi:MAG: aryl-sulfate sulfotransferase [Candidatus Thorarchaeota archaeon]